MTNGGGGSRVARAREKVQACHPHRRLAVFIFILFRGPLAFSNFAMISDLRRDELSMCGLAKRPNVRRAKGLSRQSRYWSKELGEVNSPKLGSRGGAFWNFSKTRVDSGSGLDL